MAENNLWQMYKKFDQLAQELSSDEEDNMEVPWSDQLANIDFSKVPKSTGGPGMQVSGWDDVNDQVEPDPNPHETPEKELLWAAEEDKMDVVRELLEENPDMDVNGKDSDGYSALHKAAYNGNCEMAELLLARGANIDGRTNLQWTPLHSACQWNHPKMVELLVSRGADVNALSEGKQTPLHIAATVTDCREMVLNLLKSDKLVLDVVNAAGEIPHQIARRTGPNADLFVVKKH